MEEKPNYLERVGARLDSYYSTPAYIRSRYQRRIQVFVFVPIMVVLTLIAWEIQLGKTLLMIAFIAAFISSFGISIYFTQKKFPRADTRTDG